MAPLVGAPMSSMVKWSRIGGDSARAGGVASCAVSAGFPLRPRLTPYGVRATWCPAGDGADCVADVPPDVSVEPTGQRCERCATGLGVRCTAHMPAPMIAVAHGR